MRINNRIQVSRFLREHAVDLCLLTLAATVVVIVVNASGFAFFESGSRFRRASRSEEAAQALREHQAHQQWFDNSLAKKNEGLFQAEQLNANCEILKRQAGAFQVPEFMRTRLDVILYWWILDKERNLAACLSPKSGSTMYQYFYQAIRLREMAYLRSARGRFYEITGYMMISDHEKRPLLHFLARRPKPTSNEKP